MTTAEVYYDPYDFDIDTDPYPVWKRLRDERPLYFNEKYGFWALSRFADVDAAFMDWSTYSSAKGTVLEMVKANATPPIGMFIFEDPPAHDAHRGLLTRAFTPRKMSLIEPQIRRFCTATLDAFEGTGTFDFIKDLGAILPMQVIGMLLGIPEADQQAIRDRIDEGLRLKEGDMSSAVRTDVSMEHFGEYIDWRAKNPSDDVMTGLLSTEFEDETGTTRRLRRDEILGYISLLAAAGNETTTKLIGWTGKCLGDHPDQRQLVVEDKSLIPAAIEEVLRFEAPSPVQSRYVARDVELHDQTVPEGSVMVLLNGSANRDERKFDHPDDFDVQRPPDRHLSFGYGLHFCIGAALARLEARVALEEVLNRFPDWAVDLDNAVQTRTSTVRGWDSLPVIIP